MSLLKFFRSVIFILFLMLKSFCCGEEGYTPDVLLCRQCGHSIVGEQELSDIKSPLALSYKNATVLGANGLLVQTFQNPQGMSFDVITATKANIQTLGEAHPEFSWFPGFVWRIAVCPRCMSHLGWAFKSTSHNSEDPSEKYKDPKDDYSFVGLILTNLIRESFADSLIITPKIYQS